MKKSSVLIVSIFGRGALAAVDLKLQGLDVLYLDLSESFHQDYGEVSSPFGFLEPSHDILAASKSMEIFWKELKEKEILVPSPRGFTLWEEEGILEMKGPFVEHQKKRLLFKDAPLERSHKNSESPLDKVFSQIFSTVWRSYSEVKKSEVKNEEKAFPYWNGNYWIQRKSEKEKWECIKSLLQREGVDVVEGKKVLDLFWGSKNTSHGIELEGFGVLNFESMIWGLSSGETGFLSESLLKNLFEKPRESLWAWLRFKVHIHWALEREWLPDNFVSISDKYTSLSHGNACWFQKNFQRGGTWDVWVRIPSSQRFQGEYLRRTGDEILENLQGKAPGVFAEIIQYPIEFSYGKSQLGEAALPIYENIFSSRLSMPTVYFNSPESSSSYEGFLLWKNELEISEKIQVWWKQVLIKRAKGK